MTNSAILDIPDHLKTMGDRLGKAEEIRDFEDFLTTDEKEVLHEVQKTLIGFSREFIERVCAQLAAERYALMKMAKANTLNTNTIEFRRKREKALLDAARAVVDAAEPGGWPEVDALAEEVKKPRGDLR